jgi:hypothetical protein
MCHVGTCGEPHTGNMQVRRQSDVDVHEGWLVFKLPPGELGIHPIEPSGSGRHELYLMCDDIEQTMQQLNATGVEFSSEITDAGSAGSSP